MALHGGGYLKLKKMHKGDFWGIIGIRLGRCPCIIPEKISFLQFYSRFNPNALALYNTTGPRTSLRQTKLAGKAAGDGVYNTGIYFKVDWSSTQVILLTPAFTLTIKIKRTLHFLHLTSWFLLWHPKNIPSIKKIQDGTVPPLSEKSPLKNFQGGGRSPLKSKP